MPYIFNTYGGEKGCIRILWGKLWKRDYILGRASLRLEDNIKMDLKELGRGHELE
jgi:hypothetical protein